MEDHAGKQLAALRDRLASEERERPAMPLDMDGGVYHERLKPQAMYACLSCRMPTSVPEKHRGHVVVRR